MQPLIWKNVLATALTQDAALQADWDRLNAERGNLPFLSSEAVVLALKIFRKGGEQLLTAHRGDRCLAMLLLTEGRWRCHTFQPSQLPLGAWVASTELSISTLAHSALTSGVLPLCLSMSITQMDPLLAPRESDSLQNRHDDYIETAWVDIVGTFDEYWAARGKNLRQNMRKQRNKLIAEGSTLEMRVWRAIGDMQAAIARYGELESKSWKAQEGTAIELNNSQGRFYSTLFENAAALGEAAVYEYFFDGKVVASNLCLQRAGTLVILKTTYDESIKAYSPAFMLNEELIQSLFAEQKIIRLEYYGRIMEWHTRWTENRRTTYHLTTFRHHWIKTGANFVAKRKSRSATPMQLTDLAATAATTNA